MTSMSSDQWRLVLTAACAECEGCGGKGRVLLYHRKKRVTRAGRVWRQPRAHWTKCVRCKNWRRLLEVLARRSRADVEQARLEDEAFEDAARLNGMREVAR